MKLRHSESKKFVRYFPAEYGRLQIMAIMAIKTAKTMRFLASDEAKGRNWGWNGGWSSEFTQKSPQEPQKGCRDLKNARAPLRRHRFQPKFDILKIALYSAGK